PRVAVRCSSEVIVASGRATLVAHVQLQPRVGGPDRVYLLASSHTAGKWEWKAVQGDNLVRAFVPVSGLEAAALALMDAGLPLAQAVSIPGALHLPVGGQRWLLLLDRPLRETVSLDATCEIARGPDGRWEVPLLCAPPTDDVENDVTVFLAGVDLSRIET